MSRWSPTVVPWAKDPWEIQGQIVGQLGQARRLTDMSKRTDIYGRATDQQIEASQGAERRADLEQDVWFAEYGGMTPEMEGEEAFSRIAQETAGPQGVQGGYVPDPTAGLVGKDSYQRMPPQINPQTGQVQRTPGIVPEDTEQTRLPEPGNLVDALRERLQLAGGGSIAAPGDRPAAVEQRRATAEKGEAAYKARREAGVALGPNEREYMRLSGGEQAFTGKGQEEGFAGNEELLDFLYDSGMVHPSVLSAMIDQDTSSQNRGPTWAQSRQAQQIMAINWVSEYMRDNGVTAAEAWRAAPPEIQNLVTAGSVGKDVYDAGKPGAHAGTSFGVDEEGALSSIVNPRASDAFQRYKKGADVNMLRHELMGDDAALRAFDMSVQQEERWDLSDWIQSQLLTGGL